jgi:hypothetical protein
MFPGLYINVLLGSEKGDGGTKGSVVNHVGFIVDNVQLRVAQRKAAGVAGLPGLNNRVVNFPGMQLRVARADLKQAPTRGRILDHFGFDVKGHAAFVARSRRPASGSIRRCRRSPTAT